MVTNIKDRLIKFFLIGFGAISFVIIPGTRVFKAQSQKNTNHPEFVEGRVVAKFRRPEKIDAVLSKHGAKIEKEIADTGVFVLRLPNGAATDSVTLAMKNHPDVEFAELDRFVNPARLPNDPYFPTEWHLSKIAAPDAWDVTTGNSGLIVAVLDTGVDSNHPDLAPHMIPGWNTYDNNSNTADVYGHGTAVAGTIAATTDNYDGVSSLVWNCLIMPIRISDPSGWATYTDAAEGLTWAADHGARVANISYEMSTSSAVASAAQYFQNRGGVVTISAGNSAAYLSNSDNPYVLTVSATDPSDNLASWSNQGTLIDVSAPGVDIYTTFAGGGYGPISGTSFSAPITAGVAALVLSANPGLSGSQAQSVIKRTADDLGTSGWDAAYGYGRLNAAAAVTDALGGGSSADTTPPTAAFVSPKGGATLAGTVSADVNANDNNAVASVTLKLDGSPVGVDTLAPYGFVFSTTGFSNGTHTLTAVAVDAAGNEATASVSVSISNVKDSTPPVPQFTSPKNGASVNGNITVSANATDNIGVVKVEMYVDGNLKAVSNSASASTRWNTKQAGSGSHLLTAKAYDAAGNVGTVSITVYK